jgi:hypothetical protein
MRSMYVIELPAWMRRSKMLISVTYQAIPPPICNLARNTRRCDEQTGPQWAVAVRDLNELAVQSHDHPTEALDD